MAGFVFRLKPLLEARKRAEQDAQRDVAVLERQRLDLEQQLRGHQQNLARDKHELRGSLTGAIDLRSLRLGAGAALHVVRLAQQAVLQLVGLSRRLESAREKLLEATTRRRAIELLRDRRYQRWKKALDKAETAALDEFAARGARKGAES